MVSKTHMTADEFFQLPETNQPTELIDGELIVSAPPIPKHQRLNRRFVILLDDLIPDGELFFAPIGVYFDAENIPEPDIVWLAENSKCGVGDKYLEGPPDLIIEIFSPGTARFDRREKYELYERYGVREYWMADPEAQYVEVWTGKDGKFFRHGVYGADDSFNSPVLGGKTVELKGIFESE
jgi:Uma2 family endonuclease